jgi:chromate transporter
MHRLAVDVHHWMTDADFIALFAIAQAAPGPNFMISTLVGWKAAGAPGALVATAAMCGPSCLLTYWVAKVWDRFRETPWRRALAQGLAPVSVGLMAATFWLLVRAADRDVRLAMVTVATMATTYFTRLNPLWCLAAAAGLGLLGVL